MTPKTIKRTIEEVTAQDGTVSESVKAIEIALVDGETEKGYINVNEWGGNFNLINGGVDVELLGTEITKLLTPTV